MSLLAMVFVYLRSHWASSMLHVMVLALGVALMSALLLLGHQLDQRLYSDGKGIDAVVGAKGSPLQLVLSSVQHIDVPTGNIPYLALGQIRRHPSVSQAIPIALGDHYRRFRIVGSEPAFMQLYDATLAQGTLWNQPMQAVIGAQVAQQTGLAVGDRFAGNHGLSGDGHDHAEALYEVVGIAAPTGRVLDRLIVTDLTSVWQLHAPHGHDHHEHSAEIAPERQDITALLVSYRKRSAALSFPAQINRTTSLQAASPALEMARLGAWIGFGSNGVMAVGGVLIMVSLISVLIGLFNAVAERRADLALFRVLGASRPKIMALVAMEGMIIACIGTCLGACMAYGGLALLSALTSQGAELGFGDTVFLPQLLVLWLSVLIAALLVSLIPAWQVYRFTFRTLQMH